MTADEMRTEPGSRRLHVEMALVPDEACTCPLVELPGEVRDVRKEIVDGECHTDVTVNPRRGQADRKEGGVYHVESDVRSACPCLVFSEFGCVPRVLGVEGSRIRVEVYLADRSDLTALVDELRQVTDGFELRQLVRVPVDEAAGESAALDVSALTEKQREAVVCAVEAGYYSRRDDASFQDIADCLGISKSALSQRLTAAESKLATAAFEQMTDER